MKTSLKLGKKMNINSLDNFFSKLEQKFRSVRYDFLKIIDPFSKRNDDEIINTYVFRLEKRHAIRYLDFALDTLTEYDDDYLNRLLMFEKDKAKIDEIKITQRLMDIRFRFKILKQQIKKY